MSRSGPDIGRNALLWQLLSVLLAVLPHLIHLSFLLTGFVVFCVGWRLLVWRGRFGFPHWLVRALLVMIALGIVLTGYRAGAGISTTVGLLIAGFSLKLIELYKRRDALVMLYVAVMVTATAFLFDQSIWTALYVMLTLVVILTAITTLYTSTNRPFWHSLKRSVGFVLPALPLMVVLFLVMPRLGALWEVRLDPATARTGLSDSMGPGSISQLLRSPQVAFRVSFAAEQPPQSSLYWRALVLPDFDGKKWFNARISSALETSAPRQAPELSKLNYELILEPNQKTWVPVLESVTGFPAELKLRKDATLVAPQKQLLRQQYQLQSTPGLRREANILQDAARYLRVPPGNPQSRALVESWQGQALTAEHLITKILQRYTESFVYTLRPPPLGQNSVDDFLFSTQRGFCGHFASATAYLLRLAGVPARVVTGYQGGEFNPFEQYYTLRQYDAHAWIEAWIEGQGWVRIDPTAAVAPQRVEQSADQLFAGQDGFLNGRPALGRDGLLASIRLRWEAINYGWQRWVLNYHHQQEGLLQSLLGNVSVWKMAMLLLLPFVVVISLVMLRQLWPRNRQREDMTDRQVRLLSEQLAHQGLQRAPGETVGQYFKRLSGIRHDLVAELTALSELYENIRFADQSQPEFKQQFVQLVKDCRQKFN
ncbi:transglutaminase TgpA family protein [Pontibacter sp. JAM-7]|uniref:transglutaminase TgpA family protein n=1 Tax=Pontibacter sp. JAM-7 TaxID=3366581 RepID=UPI003AF53466